jgi:hypothetical protein
VAWLLPWLDELLPDEDEFCACAPMANAESTASAMRDFVISSSWNALDRICCALGERGRVEEGVVHPALL